LALGLTFHLGHSVRTQATVEQTVLVLRLHHKERFRNKWDLALQEEVEDAVDLIAALMDKEALQENRRRKKLGNLPIPIDPPLQHV
jgi:hypothetical protein